MKYFPFDKFWSTNKVYAFILHEHDAEKAGLHYDLRIEIDNPKDYISSLAGRNILKLILGRGKRILLIPQDLHHKEWLNIKNMEIKRGYGKGVMKMVFKGNIKVETVSNNSMKFYMKIKECGEVLSKLQCEKISEKIIPFAMIVFGKNLLLIKGKN